MNKKLFSEATAKKLMIGGVIGFVSSIVLSLATVFTLYSKVGNCGFGNTTGSCKTDNFTWQTIAAHIGLVLAYVSIAAIVIGVLMIIAVSIKAKQQQIAVPLTGAPSPVRTINTKRLFIKTLALIAAFFVSTFIAIMIVISIVPALSSTKDTNKQGHIFAYIIIPVYPLVGGFSVYFTNKYLNKKLK